MIFVDDAHWLDRSTSGVLTFIARRLENEPVALLVSVRAGVATPLGDAGLPTLELERLSPSAVRQTARPAQVLESYGALAEVVTDPERRVWHQARATVGYSEQVAAALERHAAAARRRSRRQVVRWVGQLALRRSPSRSAPCRA